MNRACFASIATLLAVSASGIPCTAQQWSPRGFRLCESGCPGDLPKVVSDGAGGAYVTWRDTRNSYDVYLQRVTADGVIPAGWPLDGLPIVDLPSVQESISLASDGLGGAVVAWDDYRYFPGTASDPFVQRILSDASVAPGWAPLGDSASLAPRDQTFPQVAPDGSGGVFVTWEDTRDLPTNDHDVYAQHLTSAGAVAPGWPGGGLPIAAFAGYQGGPRLLSDDTGGALIYWFDGRVGDAGGYAKRVNGDGSTAAGWPTNGLLVTPQFLRPAVRDEAGGFFVVWAPPSPTPGLDGAYYLMRYTFGGNAAPGWPAGGVPVCTAPGTRAGVTLDSDGMGGALLSWYDYRPPYDVTGGEIFAARVLSNGALAPGWAANGTLLSDQQDLMQSYDPFIVRDGAGGAYVAWQSQGGSEFPSRVQHLTPNGQPAPGWPAYGLRVAPSGAQYDTRIAADGYGGAILVWDEGNGVWAQRYAPNGPTPVVVSLARVTAEPDRVTVVWQFAGGAAGTATVYRRIATASWEALGAPAPEGADRARYEDRSVMAGGRYAYRLGWSEGGLERFSAETWVDVPVLELTLDGFRPNPAVGPPTVSLTLPAEGPATLEAYDISGRQVFARQVGSLGPGSHLVRLDSANLSPGIYHLRLRSAITTRVARGLVVR